jgi:molybdate transport system substrate-binding protein
MKPILKLFALLAVTAGTTASADEGMLAVAANFTAPMKEIIVAFEQETGHQIDVSFASTGKLYAQIKNGAPFEVLLAADDERPKMLEEEGMAVRGTRFTYAVGTLVLWSAKPDVVDDEGRVLERGDFERLAIANPKLAPYGKAAAETLKALGLRDAVESRLVLGENIAQTFQFVDTSNADLGFVALAQVMRGGKLTKGSGWIVPGDMHHPIRQDAVILENGKGNRAVAELMDYLKGDKARAIIKSFGYEV